MLKKTRTVLKQAPYSDGSPTFLSDEEEGTSVILDQQVWIEMGQPTQITITVRPGDKLN